MNNEDKLELTFLAFHMDNPHVYEEVKKIALDLLRSGRDFYGIGAIFEIVRYHRAMTTNDPIFKLCNNHRAFYSRLLMRQEPELAGFFRTKERQFERKKRLEEAA